MSLSDAFEITVIVFLKTPTLSVAYFTLMSLVSPGKIGALEYAGTVHPQEVFTVDITIGDLPVLVNVNVRSPFSFC